MRFQRPLFVLCCIILIGTQVAAGRQIKGSVKSSLLSNLESISARVIGMAGDFPKEKINYKPSPEVRSFAEILLHIAGTNYYYIRAVTKRKVGPEDPRMHEYDSNEKISRFLADSFNALRDEISSQDDASAAKDMAVWIESIMHINEHYGNLVVYYRLNGIIPPSSR